MLVSLADASFTMTNILSVTEGVQDHEGLGVLLGIRDPKAKFAKVKQMHKDDPAEQKNALLGIWYSTHPLASWSLLHQALIMLGDTEAAKTVQEKFLGGGSLVFDFAGILCFIWLGTSGNMISLK